MQDNKERWMDLCAQASVEQDPERLLALVQEISRLLEKKELSNHPTAARSDDPTDRGL
jgi:hypothetical protein